MAEWSIADLPNTFILKYEYSKQFNNQYRAQALLVKKKAIEQGGEFLEPEVWRKENRD